jgi:hypothetical protein
MEDNQVSFLPAMCIDIFRSTNLPLHLIDYLSHLLDIIHDRNLSSMGATRGEFVHAAAMDLKEGSLWIEGVSPNHLGGSLC